MITYNNIENGELMKKMVVAGNSELSGTIEVSGAKNSAVALLPASILSDGIVTINNVPNISDIDAIEEILIYLGATVTRKNNTVIIDNKNIVNKLIPMELAKKLRASYYFMGSLLGRFNSSLMSFPGGCAIGARPIDLHLKGFEDLGVVITPTDNAYESKATKLIGTDLYVKHSVGATINLLFASVKASGTTIIHEAAKEPEIGNVVSLLISMGAKIEGLGTDTLTIIGTSTLKGATISVIPDRIEAGTYLIAGAICGNNLKISNVITSHMTALIDILKEMGANMEVKEHEIIISKQDNLKPVAIRTAVYPGFPTDLQQPMTTLLTMASGNSTMEETIYENRFKHVQYLNKMGANIEVKNRMLAIIAPTKLHGSEVVATDLRAGAALVLASLIADSKTVINDVEHILRGYDNIIYKLTNVGAKIKLEEI